MKRDSAWMKKVGLRFLLIAGVAGLFLSRATWKTAMVLATTGPIQVPNTQTTLPVDYRDWRLVSVAHEAGNLNDLRAVLGNDKAIEAYRAGTLPFPDGAIIARLAWTYTASEENNKVFGKDQSFVAGTPTNVQLMVKDSKKYATTGGWGFEQFDHGKPASAAATTGCFACHTPVGDRDYVFTRYAP